VCASPFMVPPHQPALSSASCDICKARAGAAATLHFADTQQNAAFLVQTHNICTISATLHILRPCLRRITAKTCAHDRRPPSRPPILSPLCHEDCVSLIMYVRGRGLCKARLSSLLVPPQVHVILNQQMRCCKQDTNNMLAYLADATTSQSSIISVSNTTSHVLL
jgi:hypothetical protein